MPHADHSISATAVYSRQPDIVSRNIVGETILVPVRGELALLDRLFVLNGLGEHIWQALDGKRTISEICASIVDAFDVNQKTANRDLIEFVVELEEAGLVVAAPHDE